MLHILLLAMLQTPYVVFGAFQESEAELLDRYLDTLKIRTFMGTSAATTITMYTSPARASAALASFAEEFHVSYSHEFPSSIVQDVDYNLSAHVVSKPGMGAVAEYDRGSLVFKALQSFETGRPPVAHDQLVAYRYCLRPWITSKLKRTETISAVFTFLHQGKRVEYRFTYDGAEAAT